MNIKIFFYRFKNQYRIHKRYASLLTIIKMSYIQANRIGDKENEK